MYAIGCIKADVTNCETIYHTPYSIHQKRLAHHHILLGSIPGYTFAGM